MRRWFKLFMQKRTRPMSMSYAKKKKENYAIAYCFFAWNAAALYLYYIAKESYPMTEDEKKRPGFYYARLLQSDNYTVYHIDGLTVTDRYEVNAVPKLQPDVEEFETECAAT